MLPPLLQGSLHDDGAFVVMEAVADRVEAEPGIEWLRGNRGRHRHAICPCRLLYLRHQPPANATPLKLGLDEHRSNRRSTQACRHYNPVAGNGDADLALPEELQHCRRTEALFDTGYDFGRVIPGVGFPQRATITRLTAFASPSLAGRTVSSKTMTQLPLTSAAANSRWRSKPAPAGNRTIASVGPCGCNKKAPGDLLDRKTSGSFRSSVRSRLAR